MDDFGNDYQNDAWAYASDVWACSTATFGFFDEDCYMYCFEHHIDYVAADI